ncbi:MAG TPA: DUF2244 domain-containing protein [Rhizomicrobium sp.]|nr:DUF2244 domain-containing protein [Rhizomicrobium sp.]
MSDDPLLLDTVLRPSPPMSPRALGIVFAAVLMANLAFALNFLLRGAWPIAPFMGADVALLGWALTSAARAARRYEHVTLTPSRLAIIHHPVKGAEKAVEFNPYWVRVSVENEPQPGSRLTLTSHGKSIQVGAFLGPNERLSFADVLKKALNAAREFRPS